MITERSKYDPYIGEVVVFPGCDVNIVASQRYEVTLIDFEEPRSAFFIARRYVDLRTDRHWILDPCCSDAVRPMNLWVSEIIDQIGNEIVAGLPWNYDKFWDNKTLTVAA
jgi:hypothetical protein